MGSVLLLLSSSSLWKPVDPFSYPPVHFDVVVLIINSSSDSLLYHGPKKHHDLKETSHVVVRLLLLLLLGVGRRRRRSPLMPVFFVSLVSCIYDHRYDFYLLISSMIKDSVETVVLAKMMTTTMMMTIYSMRIVIPKFLHRQLQHQLFGSSSHLDCHHDTVQSCSFRTAEKPSFLVFVLYDDCAVLRLAFVFSGVPGQMPIRTVLYYFGCSLCDTEMQSDHLHMLCVCVCVCVCDF